MLADLYRIPHTVNSDEAPFLREDDSIGDSMIFSKLCVVPRFQPENERLSVSQIKLKSRLLEYSRKNSNIH